MAILTVYTKLLDKTLHGSRIIDMGSTKTCQCFVMPYEKASEISKTYLQGKYAFYILLGQTKLNGREAYIGQTNDFATRVVDHKLKKQWWDTALVFVSKAEEIYKTEIEYLEYLGWKTAVKAKQYTIANTKPIKEPGISDDKKNDMEQFFEDIMFLTEFYGCEVFVKKTNPLQDMGVFEIFQLEVKKRDIKARIQYIPQSNKYILMEGSTISAIESSCSKRAKEIRKLLIENPEYTKREGNVIKILQNTNIPVESGKPSTPASVITGTSMQGTTAFKNKDGKTFADLYQKNA